MCAYQVYCYTLECNYNMSKMLNVLPDKARPVCIAACNRMYLSL